MRAGQSFAMRYPLVDVKGNAGTLIESGNWAAMRYTESRLSKLSGLLFNDIEKDTINEWRDSYDNTKQFPAVLPSKGFYNIVNGTQGIGIGMASSAPQYNLRELNNALIYLIDHPDCNFEDIYCAPDFATGAILYNENEVKESMKNGTGSACKLRSVVEFDVKERCFIVTEIPYGVYTNTICGELEEIVNGESNPGIERFNDLTGEKPLIKIYLNKKANPDNVLKFLYKETSLQSYYSINFTMLDHGRFPRVFTWKEMLQEHINHEKEVYRRGFEFDLNKIRKRLNIIDGLLICMNNIDRVVYIIKNSSTTALAADALQAEFNLNAEQVKAILDMKLSRLARLEVNKLIKEKESLLAEYDRIDTILHDTALFNNELKRGWQEVANKFGDDRRTKIMNLTTDEEDNIVESKQLSLSFTNQGAVFVNEISSLYASKRNAVGNKFKLDKMEYIINSINAETNEQLFVFTNAGKFYTVNTNDFIIDSKQYLSSVLPLDETETICAVVQANKTKEYILFITKNGLIKKSKMSDYNLKRKTGALAIKLDEDDSIVNVLFAENESVGLLTKLGHFAIINTENINAIGRVARGVIAMKLNDDDYIIAANIVTDANEYCFVSKDGFIKRVNATEFSVTGRGSKGVKVRKDTIMADFLPLKDNKEIISVSSAAQIKVKVQEIPLSSKEAIGNKIMKLKDTQSIIKLLYV